MILNSAVMSFRNWNMIINLVDGFVRNSYCDIPRFCPNTGSRRLGAAIEFSIMAQCKPPVQTLKHFASPVGLLARPFTIFLSTADLLQLYMEMVQHYE